MRKSPGTNTLRQGTGFESRKKLNLRAKEVRRKFMQIKKLITESPRLQKLDNGHLESLELNIFLTNLHKFKGLKTDWKVQCRLNDNKAVLYDEDEASPARQTIVFCVLLVKAQQTRISRLWGGAAMCRGTCSTLTRAAVSTKKWTIYYPDFYNPAHISQPVLVPLQVFPAHQSPRSLL